MKEKKQSERKLLRVLLVLALVIGLVSGMNGMAYADNDPVDYRTATVDGTTHAVTFRDQQCTNYTIVTADTQTFGDGKWYVVNADVTINERITVNGTANLILVDGKTLNAQKGITVSDDDTLNIYGQSSDTGALNAEATCVIYDDFRIIRSAAIGGYIRLKTSRAEDVEYDEVDDGQPIFYFPNCGTINIYGGVITANCPGDSSDAGIGGVSGDAQVGNVTVYGGNVTAIGGMYGGAGIGGGSGGSGGNVTVYGGIIRASGSEGAMGIGKGDWGQDNGNLTVASTHTVYSHTAAITNDNKDTADKAAGTGTESTITRKRYMLVEPGVTHSHSFTYSASGATITATCNADGCTLTDSKTTLTIVKPTLTTYGETGKSADATLTGLTDFNTATGKTIAATDITYVGREGTSYAESATAPTNAGKYTAKITVEGKTASVNYTISVPVTGVALDPGEVTVAVGDTQKLTATIAPGNATDKKVKWSVGGTNSGAVKLYSDAECTNEIGTDATETLTVYAKGISAGSATVTATSNADSTKSASCAVTAEVSKTALNDAIDEAETYYNSIKDSNPTAAAALLEAINAAKSVKDNADATQEQVDAAIEAINGAKTTAENTVLTETKADLNDAIDEAETYYNSIKDSNPEAAAALKDAIDAAKAVKGNADATQAQVDAAITAINAAKSTAAETVVSDTKTNLSNAIDEAETYYNSIKDSNPTAAAALLEAVNAAKSVKDNANATQEQVDAAIEAINGAKTTAENTVLTETKADLNDAIDEAETYYNSIKDSNPEAAAALKDAIDAAKAVKGNADATQTEVDNALTALNAAKSTAEETTLQQTISQVMSEVSAKTGSGMTYTGNPIQLINTPTTALPAGYTMQYAVTTENTAPTDASLYTTSIPTATDAGTYYVWYKVVGDENHNDTEPKSVTAVIRGTISAAVTFKVVNGSWNDETTADKTVLLTGLEGDTLKLTADQIPAVGSKPADTYKEGEWDVVPSTETAITAATTYTYTYAQKDSISQTVTFKVVNGKWDDETTVDKIVPLNGHEGDALKLAADQIPAVGTKPADTFKAGAWDVTPSTETAITAATTYTYTYAAKDSISQTVTFKVVNGSWDDGNTADITVTLTGLEGDTLKLAENQIPAVGTKPADTYKAGAWDVVPSTETAITAATTYTYTYEAKSAAVVTAVPTAKALTYDGTAQELITAGAATGGTMKYAVTTENAPPKNDSLYTETIPTRTDAGTYYVWYKAVGDSTHTDSKPACVTVTIGEKIVYTAVKTSQTVDEHTIGSGEDAVLVFQRSVDDAKTIEHFTSAAVDGKTLSAGDYSVKSGSLILTLKASYLDTLTPGTHQVTATFDDGSADTTITILEAPAIPAPTDVPKTGDGADLGLWLTLMLAGLLLLGGWAVYTIRKRS